jgi:hypothetical protein
MNCTTFDGRSLPASPVVSRGVEPAAQDQLTSKEAKNPPKASAAASTSTGAKKGTSILDLSGQCCGSLDTYGLDPDPYTIYTVHILKSLVTCCTFMFLILTLHGKLIKHDKISWHLAQNKNLYCYTYLQTRIRSQIRC